MKIIEWLKPGIGVKRWIALGICSMMIIYIGFYILIECFGTPEWMLALLPIITGCLLAIISIRCLVRTFIKAAEIKCSGVFAQKDKLSMLLYSKGSDIGGPKIVAIGGGTGMSTMLRGLKEFSSNITAIVTVADDGGGSGVLREDLGILPPGDIRNCILALADTEPIMEKLLQYRFQEGMLKGQSFGNLFLAAMNGISVSFEEAVKKMSDVLAVKGRVLPVSLQNIKLCAELEDGYIICGESKITKRCGEPSGKIRRVFLEPEEVQCLSEVNEAITSADIIILGPGSLYTSIIPNLLVKGVCEALKKSRALKLYVSNIMTQPGETDGYSVLDHIQAIERHSYRGIIDHCIVNTARIPPELMQNYLNDGADIVKVDFDEIKKHGIGVTGGDFLSIRNNLVRHDAGKLAETIMDLLGYYMIAKDKKRAIGYYNIDKNIMQ